MEQQSPPTLQQGSVPKIRVPNTKKPTTAQPVKQAPKKTTGSAATTAVRPKKTAINEDIADAMQSVQKTVEQVSDNYIRINACITIQKQWRKIRRQKLLKQAEDAIK